MPDIICAFAPFIALVISGVRVQASEPYVRILQMHALYSRSLRPRCRSLLCHICLSLPYRVCAIAILALTSGSCDPPASKIEPRYFDCQAVASSSLSHFTFDNNCCSSFRFVVLDVVIAVFVILTGSISECPVLVLCVFKSYTLLYFLPHVPHTPMMVIWVRVVS